MTDLNLIDVAGAPALPPRRPDSHKGTFGKVLVVAGSFGMSGAAVLCGTAALRGGAGLVQVATPEPVALVVAGGNPCYMTAALPADQHGRLARAALPAVIELARAATAVVVGPGLGQGDDVAAVVRGLIEEYEGPLLLDADALNVLGANPAELSRRTSPFVLTPHPGEFARLAGADTAAVQAARRDSAARLAQAMPAGVVLLKGHGTLVTDGRRCYVNVTGNPGMATGGSGDVLSGLIGALLAQGLSAFDAAVLGAHVHGLAGDRARVRLGETGLIATDLLDELPVALRDGASGQDRQAGLESTGAKRQNDPAP